MAPLYKAAVQRLQHYGWARMQEPEQAQVRSTSICYIHQVWAILGSVGASDSHVTRGKMKTLAISRKLLPTQSPQVVHENSLPRGRRVPFPEDDVS